MESPNYFRKAFALICIALIALSASGQNYVTKSGTRIFPADKMTLSLPSPAPTKSSPSDNSAGYYYIVTTPDLLAPLHPFVRWKAQQGFHVRLLCPTTPQRDSIRATLSHHYSSHSDAPMFVLLVGDVDRLPAFTGKHIPAGLNNHFTDLYYGEYTGDYLPEAFVGRLSVADSSQLVDVLDKIIPYEQGLFAFLYSQLLLVAGGEDRTPAPVTTNGQVDYLAHLAARLRPEVDTVCFHNPTSTILRDSIFAALRQSNLLVNYTAHCTSRGWSRPSFQMSDIDSLSNPLPTLFFNNCCRSNTFAGDCLGEELLRKPFGGAVGVIGASNETLWAEDYYWAVGAKYPLSISPEYDSLLPGAFDAAFIPKSSTTLGDMLHRGCRAVTQAGSPFDAFYWEIYCLLGDPSMTPSWPLADTLSISLDDSIPAGNSIIHLRCTPHARITATADTLLLGTTIVPENGEVELQLGHSINADSITLTATRNEALCAIKHLKVYHPAQPYLAVTQYRLDDTLLFLHIKNQGLTPARQHRISLTRYSDQGVILPTDPFLYLPFLPSLADTLVSFNLSNCYPGIEPLLSVIIMIQDSHGTYYNTLPVNIPMPDLRPVLTRLQVLETDTTPCHQLLPNHNYLLSFTLAHPADSLGLSITPHQSTFLTPCPQQFTIPFTTPDSPSHLQLSLTPHYGLWHNTYTYYLTPYNTLEPFESADLSNLPWQFPSLYPWRIDSLQAHSGRYCLRSAPIDHSLRSVIALEIDVLSDDSISFFYNLSSEPKDWLYLFVDGRRTGFWSGNTGWQRYARPISAGHHRLEWIYQKDDAGSQHDDCARIDDLRLPLALWSQPYGTPWADTTLAVPPSPVADVQRAFSLFPNPASGAVTLRFTPSPKSRTVTLYNSLGIAVDKINLPPHTSSTQYSTTHLRFGIYTLVLHDKAGTHTQKLTVIR